MDRGSHSRRNQAELVRRVSTNQPGRDESSGGTHGHNAQKACKSFAVRPIDQRIAQPVSLLKRKAKECSHQTRKYSHHQGQYREHQ